MAQIKIRNNINESDFTKEFIHTANQELILEVAQKYNLASEFPKGRLSQISLMQASKVVLIEGMRVHLILSWSPELSNDKFGMWGFPDKKKFIEKYSQIFDILYDIHFNRSIKIEHPH